MEDCIGGGTKKGKTHVPERETCCKGSWESKMVSEIMHELPNPQIKRSYSFKMIQ